MHRIENDASKNSYIVPCVFIATGTILLNRCRIQTQDTEQGDLISPLLFFKKMESRLKKTFGISVGRLNCCWPSPVQPFVASGLVKTFDHDFSSVLDMYVFEKWRLLFDEGRGRSFSGGATFVAPHFGLPCA
jgi:hypothetical protein